MNVTWSVTWLLGYSVRTNERMKIEKPGVGRPLLGPAKIGGRKPSMALKDPIEYDKSQQSRAFYS